MQTSSQMPIQALGKLKEKSAKFDEAFNVLDKEKEGKIPSNDLITVFQSVKYNLSKKEEQEFLSVRAPRAPAHACKGPDSEQALVLAQPACLQKQHHSLLQPNPIGIQMLKQPPDGRSFDHGARS